MSKPFDGVRVLDFSRVIAGPYASEMLALLGADVVKVEHPLRGDDGRDQSMKPRYAARKYGTVFLSLNAGKRSLGLDLKHEAAREVLERLIAGADVVLENFRPGVMARLGLDYDAVKALNPRVVYCSISGFGQTGPASASPAYDGRVQATSGMMALTGYPESGPVRVGFAVCDAATGMSAAFAIASALYRRSQTGEGDHIDVAMLDTALSFMAANVQEVLAHGEVQPLLG
ncbi:MAG: crotonobetainyl-CoA:carnitine CoA-transferase CaiB-like acyl-CoA transferase, partial [Myxococcota bacterium]